MPLDYRIITIAVIIQRAIGPPRNGWVFMEMVATHVKLHLNTIQSNRRASVPYQSQPTQIACAKIIILTLLKLLFGGIVRHPRRFCARHR